MTATPPDPIAEQVKDAAADDGKDHGREQGGAGSSKQSEKPESSKDSSKNSGVAHLVSLSLETIQQINERAAQLQLQHNHHQMQMNQMVIAAAGGAGAGLGGGFPPFAGAPALSTHREPTIEDLTTLADNLVPSVDAFLAALDEDQHQNSSGVVFSRFSPMFKAEMVTRLTHIVALPDKKIEDIAAKHNIPIGAGELVVLKNTAVQTCKKIFAVAKGLQGQH